MAKEKRPAVGDPVRHNGTILAIAGFPPKLGFVDGEAFEASKAMTPDDEAAWTERQRRAMFHEALASGLPKKDAREKANAWRLRDLPPVIERRTLAVRPRPRVMRLTGSTADLVWSRTLESWLLRDGQEDKAVRTLEGRPGSSGAGLTVSPGIDTEDAAHG